MSANNARKLIDALKGNDNLKKQLQNAKDFETFASAAGYSCTAEEFSSAIKSRIVETDFSKNLKDVVVAGIIKQAVTTVF